MEKEARLALYHEEFNWLNRSRTVLMESLLCNAGPIKGNLLEIGAGSGHAIEKLAKYGKVDAIEVAPEAWPFLANKPVSHLYKTPIPNKDIKKRYGAIVGLEVLEHIEDDKATARWLASRLNSGGLLVLTVPAYQSLFGAHDIANHHYRRYTRKRLLDILPPSLTPLKSGYFMTALFPLAAAGRLAYNMRHKTGEENRPPPKQKSSLPAPVDWLFGKIMDAEAFLAGKGFSSPFGMTVYLLARKK
jgi:SAM-dependent methyltransferase